MNKAKIPLLVIFTCVLILLACAVSSQAAGPQTKKETLTYVGSETCGLCHEKRYAEFKLASHSKISIKGEKETAQGCETCHGPGSKHVDNGGGKGTMINPKNKPEVCFSCHLDKKAEFRLPNHHPVLEGKMGCADCHNPHSADVRPWTSTSFNDINEACFKCHKDKQGPFVFEHEAVREGCSSCHNPHGSIHDKMLIVRDLNLCFRCHAQANYPYVGDSNHASRFNLGTCFSAGCHTAVHGSNFDDHLRY